MKKMIATMLLLANLSLMPSIDQLNGTVPITNDDISTQVISIIQKPTAYDTDLYAVGGTVFSYDVDYFAAPPIVTATVQLVNAPLATTTYSAVITANSSTGTTVMVYKITSGAVVEAAAGEVIVNIIAVEGLVV